MPSTNAGRDLGFVTLEPEAFGAAKAISIDYAVMEKTARAAVVPVSCGWSDVGSWHAVWELSDKDAQGNASHGSRRVRRLAQLQRHHRCRAGRARRRRRSRRGRDRRCGAGLAPEGCQRAEAAGHKAQGGRAEGHRGAPQGASALGQLPVRRQWRAPPGQAHRGQAGRAAVAAEAPSSRRALDRGPRHRPRHRQRDRQNACTRTSRSTSRWARCTGWRTPARSCWS